MLSVAAALSATVALALTGAMAGLFYAFSVSVMPGLDAITAEQAIRAMQSINRKILNPVFLTTYVVAPIAGLATGGLLFWLGQNWAAVIFLGAAATYLLGAFVPTAVVNVPMNDALEAAQVPTDTDEAAQRWSSYSARWTWWNTLRALFCLISLLLIGLALVVWGRQG
jgi:uncharacterized membrane protein